MTERFAKMRENLLGRSSRWEGLPVSVTHGKKRANFFGSYLFWMIIEWPPTFKQEKEQKRLGRFPVLLGKLNFVICFSLLFLLVFDVFFGHSFMPLNANFPSKFLLSEFFTNISRPIIGIKNPAFFLCLSCVFL